MIIESRFWPNTALFMYMSEYPREQIVQLQRLVAAEHGVRSSVLVYLYQDDVGKASGRLGSLRDEQLLARDLETTSRYRRFRSRGLAGLNSWVSSL